MIVQMCNGARLPQQILVASLLGLTLVVSGCNRDNKPSGQAIATVNDEPITSSDLQLELGNAPANQRSALQPLAIQTLIDRKVLAQEARSQGMDRSPEFVLQLRRTTEALLADRVAQQIAAKARKPTTIDEINRYIDAHPYIAGSRRRLEVEQLQFNLPPPAVRTELGSARSLAEVRTILAKHGLQATPGKAVLDTATLPERAAMKFSALAVGEPLIAFELPRSTANVIVRSIDAPLSGTATEQIARNRIAAERATTALQQRGLSLRREAKITYAKAYDPRTANKDAQ